MTSFSSVTGKQLLLALKHVGFLLIRIKGSHHFIQHADGRSTVIPIHAGETIGPGLISKILRDCEMTIAEANNKLFLDSNILRWLHICCNLKDRG